MSTMSPAGLMGLGNGLPSYMNPNDDGAASSTAATNKRNASNVEMRSVSMKRKRGGAGSDDGDDGTSQESSGMQFQNGLDDDDLDDDSDDDGVGSKKKMRTVSGASSMLVSSEKTGRRKIQIEYIEDKSRRHITFSKRKAGIMKKAYELSTLTGTQVLLLVVSETGLVYTFTTSKLQPLVTKPEGKNLIQACLNAPTSSLPPDPSMPLPRGGSKTLSRNLSQPSGGEDMKPKKRLPSGRGGSKVPLTPTEPPNQEILEHEMYQQGGPYNPGNAQMHHPQQQQMTQQGGPSHLDPSLAQNGGYYPPYNTGYQNMPSHGGYAGY